MGAGTARGGACLLISGNVRKNMEFVVFAGVLLLLFIFMIVQELIQTKNQEKLFKKYLRENYGKEPPKEYSLEHHLQLYLLQLLLLLQKVHLQFLIFYLSFQFQSLHQLQLLQLLLPF